MDTVPQNMLNYNYKCCEIHLAPVLRLQINVLLIKWKATKIMRALKLLGIYVVYVYLCTII